MSANSQLRHRLRSNQRRATFSAWAMSIVFVAIAMISFAVDQSVVSFGTGGDLGQSLGEFTGVAHGKHQQFMLPQGRAGLRSLHQGRLYVHQLLAAAHRLDAVAKD